MLTGVLTAAAVCSVGRGSSLVAVRVRRAGLRGVHRLGEDVGGGGLGGPDDVCVDAKRDGGVGVAQAGGDDMNRDAREQQRCGMYVPEIVEPYVR